MKTVEQLETELADAKKVADENLEFAESLAKEKDMQLIAVTEQRNALQQENDQLKEQLTVAKSTIAQLQSKAKKSSGAKESFDLDGKKYEIVSGATIPGIGKRTPIELTTDENAQRWLVEKGSGAIREIK